MALTATRPSNFPTECAHKLISGESIRLSSLSFNSRLHFLSPSPCVGLAASGVTRADLTRCLHLDKPRCDPRGCLGRVTIPVVSRSLTCCFHLEKAWCDLHGCWTLQSQWCHARWLDTLSAFGQTPMWSAQLFWRYNPIVNKSINSIPAVNSATTSSSDTSVTWANLLCVI